MKALFAAVSLLALAVSPVLAQGKGNGGGNGAGDTRHANNGNGAAAQQQGGEHAGHSPGTGNGHGDTDVEGNAERRNTPAARAENRRNGNGNGNAGNRESNRATDNGAGTRTNSNNRADNDRDLIDNRSGPHRESPLIERVLYRDTGLVNGCPPGLAARRNGCTPPGQLRQQNDRYARYSRYAPNWWGLPYRGGSYFYEDGFLIRYDGDRIGGYIPLFGGALGIGNAWPSDYGYERVPDYHSRYYGLGPDYRYADNVMYRVDPETAVISSIAALLTGDEFVVGQPVPSGYDVYNVPYSYRDRYRDGPDRNFRYADGYIYQVDPETQLIAAAIELLI